MTRYEKIAEWIISQDVNKPLRDNDIKEIADYVFDTKLTSVGVKYVKDELLKRNYTNIRDSKIKDAFYDPTNNLFEPVVDYIYKNWRTIYSDEWIHSENIIVQNDGSYVFKSKEPNFVYIRFSGSRKEMFLKPYDYTEFYSGLKRIKIDGWKLKTVSKKKVKPKFRPGEEYYEISSITYERNSKAVKDSNCANIWWSGKALNAKTAKWVIVSKQINTEDSEQASEILENSIDFPYVKFRLLGSYCSAPKRSIIFKDSEEGFKYIVYLNGEPYYTAKSYDEAMSVESQLYSASNTEDDFQSYYGSYPDVEIRKVKDAKVGDSKVTWDDIENAIYDDFDGTEHSEVDYNDCLRSFETRKEARDIQNFIEERFNLKTEIRKDAYSGGWKVKVYGVEDSIKDSKFKDSKVDLLLSELKKNNLGNNVSERMLRSDIENYLTGRYDFEDFLYEIVNSTIEEYGLDKDYDIIERKLKVTLKKLNLKDSVKDVKDSKLPRNQKLWYGEELEKVIDPKFLRRNYQNRKLKGRKNKRRIRK